MNHDITHCKGINCKIREDCFRYQAHKEVEEQKYKGLVSYFNDGCLCQKAKEKNDTL